MLKQINKIKYKDLDLVLKIAVIISYVVGFMLINAFITAVFN